MHMKLYPILIIYSVIIFTLFSCNRQRADSSFDTSVANPAFIERHPRVLIDAAHNNSSKSDGLYKPFAEILQNDGLIVHKNRNVIQRQVLDKYDLLVIVNARGKKHKFDTAFSQSEQDCIYEWVNDGGSLLLIADHYPFGSAVADLSEKFSVTMSKGEVLDSLNYDASSTDKGQLVFSDANKLLPESPIKNGKSEKERVHKIITFTGQSLFVADTGAIILK
jgi:hypothetical protein